MPIIGVEIYPTDDLIWIETDKDAIELNQYIIVSVEEATEEVAIIRRILEKEEFNVLQDENQSLEDSNVTAFLRIANELDIQKIEANKNRIPEAIEECKKHIKEHGLDMHLITAHFSYLGKQVMFIFTADGRVDFRNLVKDLAKAFKKQIRLKQIGPRDRAKYIEGYGKCGRSLCCSTFLGSLDSVTMDMARVQNLHSKGSSKISGVCGKLLCCLGYEVKIYEELRKKMPHIGSKVVYKKGTYDVIGVDVLNQTVKIESKGTVEDNIPVEKIKILEKTT